MNDSLFKKSINKFKSNTSSYIAVGLLCGLAIILAMTISIADVSLLIVTIPFVALPFLFASTVACYFLKNNQQITIGGFFRYYVGFFSPQFRSSFKAIKSFLISLAIYFGFSLVTYFILFFSFKGLYGETFTDSFTKLINIYTSYDTTEEDLINLLYENDNLMLTFIIYLSSFPMPFAVLYFIYSASFSSLSIYYRLNVRNASSGLIRLAINATYDKYKGKMRLDWLKLNWPMLLLSLLGSALGIVLHFFVIKNINYFPALVSVGGVVLLVFYFPIYFCNMEILYERYENGFKEGNRKAIELVLRRIQTSIDLNEDERRSLEESFKNETDDNQ